MTVLKVGPGFRNNLIYDMPLAPTPPQRGRSPWRPPHHVRVASVRVVGRAFGSMSAQGGLESLVDPQRFRPIAEDVEVTWVSLLPVAWEFVTTQGPTDCL